MKERERFTGIFDMFQCFHAPSDPKTFYNRLYEKVRFRTSKTPFSRANPWGSVIIFAYQYFIASSLSTSYLKKKNLLVSLSNVWVKFFMGSQSDGDDEG